MALVTSLTFFCAIYFDDFVLKIIASGNTTCLKSIVLKTEEELYLFYSNLISQNLVKAS
jgi:hypothetical protein